MSADDALPGTRFLASRRSKALIDYPHRSK
jgi:hypothetical protein